MLRNKSKTVLVLDDDDFYMTLICAGLSEHGHTVHTDNTGKNVIDLIDEYEPQVVIADVFMEEGGVFLSRKMFEEYPNIPVIFISGSETHLNFIADSKLYKHYKLPKPFTILELNDLVNKV